MKTLKSVAYAIFCAIGVTFIMWMLLSWAEIARHNTDHGTTGVPYVYHEYNFFTMFFEEEEEVEHVRYTAYGRYYTIGEVITTDGNIWSYQTDTISDREAYDAMPVWIALDDNGTPDEIEDDIILGLVWDKETAIYDELETSLSEVFTVTRDGNHLIIEP